MENDFLSRSGITQDDLDVLRRNMRAYVGQDYAGVDFDEMSRIISPVMARAVGEYIDENFTSIDDILGDRSAFYIDPLPTLDWATATPDEIYKQVTDGQRRNQRYDRAVFEARYGTMERLFQETATLREDCENRADYNARLVSLLGGEG